MPVTPINDKLLLAGSLFIVLAISYLLAWMQRGRSSDHAVHLFFIRNIRNSGHKLPVMAERILNPTYCGYPLFLHWVLSFFNDKTIEGLVLVVNPVFNILLILVTYFFIDLFALENFPSGWACLLLALTPQFYHTYNARNMGLSARSIGIVFFNLFVQLVIADKLGGNVWLSWGGAVFFGYLILGFNKFAIQSALLCGLVMGIIFGQWGFLLLFITSLLIFLGVHPKYGSAFLIHYARYTDLYRRERALKTILAERYSVWRDLVYDIPKRIMTSGVLGVYYAYKNTFVIIVFLNPLIILCAWGWITQQEISPWLSYQSMIALSGLTVCFLISFRLTRFLGEPERYVEIITSSSTVVGVSYLINFGQHYLYFVLSWYVTLVVMQLIIANMIARKLGNSLVGAIQAVTKKVNESTKGESVRFASNNEELTRLFLNQPWQFSLYWSPEKTYGGHPYKEAFSAYSRLNLKTFENIIREYRINFCLLDKRVYQDIFTDNLDEHKRLQTLMDTKEHRLLHIEWND